MADSSKSSKRGRPRGSGTFAWRTLFQQSRIPVFLLGKSKRLRFANTAWEHLTGCKLSDELGLVCSERPSGSALARMLAPPPEVLAGQSARCRRHAPNHRTGPPWWDITFIPLPGSDDASGIVAFIEVSGEGSPAAARKIPASVMAIREAEAERFAIDCFTGSSLASQRFSQQLRIAAGLTSPVWLVGEPGAGKEFAARAIHRASPNRDRAFVSLDCTGLQPYLIESLLWGHGGLAGSDRVGVVYLKEPASLPRDAQQRVLEQVPETAKYPRVVCGSVRSPLVDVNAKSLTAEFFTRFAAFEIRVPPLRERPEDLPRLAGDAKVDPALFPLLATHPWPGNLRELRSVLTESVSAAGEQHAVQREHLPRRLRERLGIARPLPHQSVPLDESLEALERKLIQSALRKAEGNATQAAVKLGIPRNRLLRRIEALGITS